MKRFFTNLVLFTILSIAFSGFTACTSNTTSPSNVSGDLNSQTSTETKNDNYPPVPSGILQAEIRDLDGNTYKLEDKKGKVVLVDLWATWCGPCVAAMPELVALQEKYKDKNFEIIGLDIDEETPEQIKAFAQTKNLNYPLGYADDKLEYEFYKVTRLQAIPQSILINRNGKMVGIFPGGGSTVMAKIKNAVEKAVNE
jgi:thiol-disulfide isomerase/thioredoxin